MSNRFHVDIDSKCAADLMRFCKMENVPLAVLLCVDKPKKKMRFRLKSMAFHFLRRVDKKLNAMINRLSAEVEHNVSAEGQLL